MLQTFNAYFCAIVIIAVLNLSEHKANADIFAQTDKPKDSALEDAIRNDSQGYYFKDGVDYDAAGVDIVPQGEKLLKTTVAKGQGRFDFNKSLTSVINAQGDSTNFPGVRSIPSNSILLKAQYDSPAKADLLKHFDAMAHLRLAMRYNQYDALERAVSDPMETLHKASVLECLKRAGENNLDRTMESCKEESPYAHLQVPGGDNAMPDNGFFMIERVLKAIKTPKENIDQVIEDIGDIKITKTMYQRKQPQKQIRTVMAGYRADFLELLRGMVKSYETDKRIDDERLSQVSLPGIPVTELQIKNFLVLDDDKRQLMFGRLASSLAFIKTMDQYNTALSLLNDAAQFPGIQSYYKPILREYADYTEHQIGILRNERTLLLEYAQVVSMMVDWSEEGRAQIIKGQKK